MEHIIKKTKMVRTTSSIKLDLKRLGVTAGMDILVHSSLSSIGWVVGGGVSVCHALMEVIGDKGNIVMPTQTADLSDPSEWENPAVPEHWWTEMLVEMPAYHPSYTPTFGMGQVAEIFRQYPDVQRSSHPNYSFAAWGANKEELTQQPLAYSLGPNSPLDKLYKRNASILMIGTGYDSCTAFHLAEYRINSYKVEEKEAPIFIKGKRKWVSYLELDFHEELFEEIGEDLEKEN